MIGYIDVEGVAYNTGECKVLYATNGAIKAIAGDTLRCVSVSGKKAGIVSGAKVEIQGASFTVMSPSVLGLDDSATVEDIQARIDALRDIFMIDGDTVSGIAVKIAESFGVIGCLPDMYRITAWTGIHPGPMVMTGIDAVDMCQYDRVGAYLDSMRRPLPVAGSWGKIGKGQRWDTVRMMDGVVIARVIVDNGGAIGPLPLREYDTRERYVSEYGDGHTRWPNRGEVIGCWPISMVRMAEKHGVIVREVLGGYTARFRAWLQPMAEYLDTVPKWARKLVYTRLWGRLGGQPWYTGKRGKGGYVWNREDWKGYRYACRPDVSAAICGYNTEVMSDTIQRLGNGVIAAHVDAVWTKGELLKDRAGWACKAGPEYGRFYSVGTYRHGASIGEMACNMTRVDRLCAVDMGNGFHKHSGRTWVGNPIRDMAAKIIPDTDGGEQEPCDVGQAVGEWMDANVRVGNPAKR